MNTEITTRLDSYAKLSTRKRIDGMADNTKYFIKIYLNDYLSSYNVINKNTFMDYIIEKKLSHSTKSVIAIQVGKFLLFANKINKDEFYEIRHSFRLPEREWEEPLTMKNIIDIFDSITAINPKKFTRIRNRCIISIFITTGTRVSQLLALDYDDVVIEDDSISINFIKMKDNRKTIKAQKDVKTIPYNVHVGDYVIGAMIDDYVHMRGDTEGPFFLSYAGKRISIQYIEKFVRMIRDKLDIYLTPHSFRRFVASRIADKHGIHKAAIMLGHKSITTTMKYINPKTINTLDIINNLYGEEDE